MHFSQEVAPLTWFFIMAKCLFLPSGTLPCQDANYSRVTEVDLCLRARLCLLNAGTVDVCAGTLHTHWAMARAHTLDWTMQLKPWACKDHTDRCVIHSNTLQMAIKALLSCPQSDAWLIVICWINMMQQVFLKGEGGVFCWVYCVKSSCAYYFKENGLVDVHLH